jgi:ABC-type glycerol-3-phosphate transport system substrate-binding protein
MDEGHLVGVMVNASPMGMIVAEDTLAEWGFSVPETFDELLDTCNAILADDLLSSDMTLMMDSYTQQSVMNLFMKYYIITSIQEGRRVDFQNETFLHYVQRIKDELPETDTLTGERFDIIFMLPSAVDVPSTRIQPFPRIFEDQSSAVETYATIAIVNPYSDNKDAAIDFLTYCATHMTNSDYFLYQTLTDPIENPTVVSQIESLEKDIALLEAAENRTNEQEDKLADDRAQLEQLESKRYMVTEDAIRYYQSLAESLYISEGSPLSYDDALRVLAERYLNGAFDAETFAQECQSHIEMIYAEIGE